MLNPEAPPELVAAHWINAAAGADPSLSGLKGKVVLVGAFQMHCPGSARHLLPQLARLHAQFQGDEVAVIGLHTVFEKEDEQTPALLEEFLDDNHFHFPVAIDKQNGGPIPETMDAYELQGTPTLLIFDRQGRLRRHYLGQVDDIRVAAEVMALAIEARDAPRDQSIALERRLASVLVDPNDHQHEHEGGCCGGHSHDHEHAGGGCCGGGQHDHDHHHGHHHGHDHSHNHAHKDEGGCGGDGGCGCKH
ncbi:MAG: TlpA family protein disulfide reductase [Hyphomicrobiaceae bacterium]|nr:TlpA family protein disulfide reductase [Hyphomicrobiaceae bacterium]